MTRFLVEILIQRDVATELHPSQANHLGLTVQDAGYLGSNKRHLRGAFLLQLEPGWQCGAYHLPRSPGKKSRNKT